MKAISKIIALFACAFFVFGCEDIIEEDISNDMVTVTYPVQATQVESNVVNFQWNELKGAKKYRVQVISGTQFMTIDSVVTHNYATFALTPGNYQWRVRAENSAYQSTYSFPIPFEVVTSGSLSNQQVLLNYPESGKVTNTTPLTLSWTALSAAESYQVEVVNTTQSGAIVFQQSTTSTSVVLDASVLNQDGNYLWRVKAVNGSDATIFSSRTFSIDTVAPNPPQNSLPANESIVTQGQTVAFSWTQPTDVGVILSPVKFVIQFSTNSAFTSIYQTSNATTTSFSQLFQNTGTYYWRVTAQDAAGNAGAPGSVYKLTVQ